MIRHAKIGGIFSYCGYTVKVLAIQTGGVQYQLIDHPRQPIYKVDFKQFCRGAEEIPVAAAASVL